MSSVLTLGHQHSDGTSSHRYEAVPDEERTYHPEKHFQPSNIIRDMVIALADGLTVPFALSAGLSILGNHHFVVLVCLTELVAGTISKAMGVWATSKGAEHHYRTKIEEFEDKHLLEAEFQEIIVQPYELDNQTLKPLIERFVENPEKFVNFMMKFELSLEKPGPRSMLSALMIGISYFVSGLIPIIPYFFTKDCQLALHVSSGITLTCLILFGYVKALYTWPSKAIWGSIQSVLIGLFAAIAAYCSVFIIKKKKSLFHFE